MRKPSLFLAQQVRVRQYMQFGGAKVTEIDMGEVARFVCLQEHGPGAVLPPMGFGGIAGKAPPHIHTLSGPKILEDAAYVVVGEGFINTFSVDDFNSLFQQIPFTEPTEYDIRGKGWHGRLTVSGIEEEPQAYTEDHSSLPKEIQPHRS